MTKKLTSKKKRELILFTPQIEYLCMNITKEQFKEYKDVGMPYEDHEEFNDSIDYCEAIFDDMTTLSVNNDEVSAFNKFMKAEYKKFLKQIDLKVVDLDTSKNKKISHAVVGDRWIKRSWYKIKINEEFDISKLRVHFTRNKHFDSSFKDTFSLFYGDKEIEFYDSNDSNADGEYLATSNGKIYNFDVLEEDWDDDV